MADHTVFIVKSEQMGPPSEPTRTVGNQLLAAGLQTRMHLSRLMPQCIVVHVSIGVARESREEIECLLMKVDSAFTLVIFPCVYDVNLKSIFTHYTKAQVMALWRGVS